MWYARRMDTFIGFAVEVLRLVPLILAFYIPALLGIAIIKERAEGFGIKAALIFALGFGGIFALRLLGGISAPELAAVLGISLVQIAVALVLASLTVYRLAD